MAYKIEDTPINTYPGSKIGLLDTVKFTMADYNYHGYSGYYCKSGTGILGGTWGNSTIDTGYYYRSGGTDIPLPFADHKTCPIPYRPMPTTGVEWEGGYTGPAASAFSAGWGQKKYNASTTSTIYLSYRNEKNPSGPYVTGIWISFDGSSWTNLKSDHSLIFVDLAAGGGGGGKGYAGSSVVFDAGGGGGGGGVVFLALDLTKTGKVTITLGKGGAAGSNGSNSVLKTTSGVTITCKGGSKGSDSTGTGDGDSSGGAGGQVTNSLGNYDAIDASKGIMNIQVYYGKSGGSGAAGSGAGVVHGSDGGSFTTTDKATNFGIISDAPFGNTAVLIGIGGSGTAFKTHSDHDRAAGGGGGGSSAMCGGRSTITSTSNLEPPYGCGGGGGAGGGSATGWWLYENLNTYPASAGLPGCCILHYEYWNE